jgi:hypothetical protein
MGDGTGTGWVWPNTALKGVMIVYIHSLKAWYISWISFWQAAHQGLVVR